MGRRTAAAFSSVSPPPSSLRPSAPHYLLLCSRLDTYTAHSIKLYTWFCPLLVIQKTLLLDTSFTHVVPSTIGYTSRENVYFCNVLIKGLGNNLQSLKQTWNWTPLHCNHLLQQVRSGHQTWLLWSLHCLHGFFSLCLPLSLFSVPFRYPVITNCISEWNLILFDSGSHGTCHACYPGSYAHGTSNCTSVYYYLP